jgi:rRNA processing protein Krr1/Pno1
MLARGSMHKSVYTMLQGAKRREKLDKMRLWEDSYEKKDDSTSF